MVHVVQMVAYLAFLAGCTAYGARRAHERGRSYFPRHPIARFALGAWAVVVVVMMVTTAVEMATT